MSNIVHQGQARPFKKETVIKYFHKTISLENIGGRKQVRMEMKLTVELLHAEHAFKYD